MVMAYDELERNMNELKNNIGTKVNPSDSDARRVTRTNEKHKRKDIGRLRRESIAISGSCAKD